MSDDPGDLTPRELEVVHLVVDGHLDSEIADLLYVSVRTVNTHVLRARAKLGARSRTDLAVKALRRGLVSLQPDDGCDSSG